MPHCRLVAYLAAACLLLNTPLAAGSQSHSAGSSEGLGRASTDFRSDSNHAHHLSAMDPHSDLNRAHHLDSATDSQQVDKLLRGLFDTRMARQSLAESTLGSQTKPTHGSRLDSEALLAHPQPPPGPGFHTLKVIGTQSALARQAGLQQEKPMQAGLQQEKPRPVPKLSRGSESPNFETRQQKLEFLSELRRQMRAEEQKNI